MNKNIAKILLGIMVTTTCTLPISNVKNIYAKELEERATGNIKPSEEALKWLDENGTKVKGIKYNIIAKERIESDRKVRSNINVVSIGDEIQTDETMALNNEDLDIILSNVDNSELKYFPPIGDQEDLNSCSAFSTGYYQMSHMTALANDWDNKNNNMETKFSPKFTYNTQNRGRNEGVSAIDCLTMFKEIGGATWADFPYVGKDNDSKNYLEWPTDAKIWSNASKYKAKEVGEIRFSQWSNHTPITDKNDEDLNQIKKLLMNGYVLNFDTYIKGGTTKLVKDNPNSSNDDKYISEYAIAEGGKEGHHSMTIVGYNDDIWVDINENNKIDKGELGAFKIANSWSDSYANKGFIWFAYDSLNKKSSVEGFVNSSTRKEMFEDYDVLFMNAEKAKKPKLHLEFTAEHSDRSQINLVVAAKDSDGKESIDYTGYASIFKLSGGTLGFNGTENASQGTFILDLDKFIKDPKFNAETFDKWVVNFRDYKKDDKPLVIKDVKLVDENGQVIKANENTSVSVDGSFAEFTFDYKMVSVEQPKLTMEWSNKEQTALTLNLQANKNPNTTINYNLYENGKLIKSSVGGNGFDGNATIGVYVPEKGEYEYKAEVVDNLGNKQVSNVIKFTK